MEDKKQFPKGAVTWSEIRTFAYFGTVLITVILYINGIATKVDLANQRLDSVNSRLINHDSKLNSLSTDYQLTNDRLTRIETTLQINQQEGRISDASIPAKSEPKSTLAPELALGTTSPQSGQSASITSVPQPTAGPNTTTNNFFLPPTPIPTPTQATENPVPSPTQTPSGVTGIVSGVLNSLGL